VQEFRPGDTINNRYKVTRKLGAGAMGSVYLCEDLVENNIKVALKVLISENLDDQDVWAKGEYEALTRLRHPNLARVYNFGKIGETKDYFIVSEFIKGIDLYTATEYVHYDELNDIVVQICRALEYIHSQGYVHFDIKPDNILVTRHKTLGLKDGSKLQYTDEDLSPQNRSVFSKPSVKLIDFGLAEKITGSFSFAIKGTLNYLAPEIINGTTPDKRADLYSLGVTLYQVTNRDLPFYQDPNLTTVVRGQKRSDLFESHMKKQPEYLRVLIMKLLEERPEDRFQGAKEVIQFLNKTSGQHFDLETKETQASYLYCARLVGRKKELNLLKDYYERIFFPQRYAGRAPQGTEKGPEEPDLVLGSAAGPAVPAAPAQPALVSAIHPQPPAPGSPEAAARAPALAEAGRAAPLAAEGPDDDLGSLPLPPAAGGMQSPPLIVISGEMGVGKSRLLEEFQHFLRLNDIKIYTGNCYEGKSNAYQPFVEILRHMVYELGLDSEIYRRFQADIWKLLPELVGKNDSREVVDRHYQEKIYFIDRITQFFLEVAERSPYVLTINNLHWGDEVTVELLGALVDRICEKEEGQERLKVMFVVSQRTDDRPLEALKGLWTRLKEAGCYQEILLRRLKRAHLVEILQTILNLNEVPSPFLDRLEERTGGNPLFVMETLKALYDEGILKNTGAGWSIKAANYNRIEIPHSLEELLIKRAQRLEPVKRQLLEVMSVLNKPLSPKLLAKFERFADLPILIHLRDLEEAGLVSKLFEGGKLQFQIDQPKMQEILYQNLEPDLRRRYHGEVGRVLAELFRGREEEVLEELAYHFQRSDETDRALELAARAGDRLKAIYANDRSYEYYLYIIEKIENDLTRLPLWIETHEKLGDLCTTMGKYDIAERSYESLLHTGVREKLEPEAVSRAWRKKGKVHEIQGDYDNALKCYKEARTFLSQIGETNLLDERTRVFNSIGWVYVCMGKYEKALAISLEGLRVIQGSVEKIEHAMIFNTIGSANFYKGNISQAIEFHSRSLKIHENLEDIPEVTASLNNLGSAFLANAEYGEALEQFKRALAASEEIGDPYGRAMTLYHFAKVHFDVGQAAKAEEYLRESLRLSKNYNMRYLNIQNYILLGVILRDRRDHAKAEGNLFRALTAFSKQGNRWGLCTVILEIAEVHRLRRNFGEAMTMVEEGFRYASDLDIDYLRALCLLSRARLVRESGERNPENSLKLLKEALAAASKVENPEIAGRILCEMGEVLVRGRRLQEAREQFRAAAEKFRAVLDRLPKEFRQSYQEKHRDKFHSDGSLPLAAEVPSQAAGPFLGAAAGGPMRKGDPLCEVNDLMAAITELPTLREFLRRLLSRLMAVSEARSGYVFERRGDRLHVLCSMDSSGRALEGVGEAIQLSHVERALSERSPLIGDDTGIFPYSIPRGPEGVVYLRGAQLSADPESLPIYQAFLNLIPVAFLSLPRAISGDGKRKPIEVQPEEIPG
jgi:serine/threonine protein kinase/tetratricopeptide (TPR) repeat protein